MSVIRRMRLGILLIVASCAVLLYTDKDQRTASARAIPRVALVKYSSTLVLDDAVRGITTYLHERGYQEGRNIQIDPFSAENDMATNTAIAREVTSGKYDFVFTVSTNCLQSVANANREGRVKHVFGAVADPLAAKVGIDPKNPLGHPKNMVGIGSLAPIDDLLAAALRCNPKLHRVGLPWNPSQANSEMYTHFAREVAKKLGLELLEGTVDNTAAVGEVTGSLISRGAEMILMHGDQTVALALDTLVSTAQRGHIPVFSTMPVTVDRGVLFAAGADYYELGRLTGEQAERVLHGEDMSKMPILYIMPRQYAVNRKALAGLKESWIIPEDLLKAAKKVL